MCLYIVVVTCTKRCSSQVENGIDKTKMVELIDDDDDEGYARGGRKYIMLLLLLLHHSSWRSYFGG